MGREQTLRRARVFELDFLRVITSCSVVCIHVISSTDILNKTTLGLQLQNALVTALHYSREIFMFVTAFAMVYVYLGKPFPLGRFWQKRGWGVLFPYVAWSLLYTWINGGMPSPNAFLRMATLNILSGNASYHLYYIMLTVQFYVFLPLFLWFLRRFGHHPWKLLTGSFVLQIVMMSADYAFLQRGPLTSPFWTFVAQYQISCLLTYQFYFVLGGMTALYFEQVRSFLLDHGKLVVGMFIATLAALWFSYFFQVRVNNETIQYASSPLQPLMVPYALTATLLVFWLACCWARNADQKHPPKLYRLVRTLSYASFGLYLLHVLILTQVLHWVVPQMPAIWPVAFRVMLAYLVTLGSSLAVSICLTRIPFISMLVGRTGTIKHQPTLVATAPIRTQPLGGMEVAQRSA